MQQRSPDSQRKASKTAYNFNNINIHTGFNEAKTYSDLVASHMAKTKRGNFQLTAAERGYKREQVFCKSSQPRTLNPLRSNYKSQKVYQVVATPKGQGKMLSESTVPELQAKNPYLLDIFENKTLRVGELSQSFQDNCQEKQRLQARIEELKRLIMNEKKVKSKTSLKSCRHMNTEELTNYYIAKKQDRSRKLRIEAVECSNENYYISKNINAIRAINAKIHERIQYYTKAIDLLTQHVKYGRALLHEYEKALNQLKQQQSIAYKMMTNTHMVLTIHYNYKAKLLVNIEREHLRNTYKNIS